jgi:hypothetical protein
MPATHQDEVVMRAFSEFIEKYSQHALALKAGVSDVYIHEIKTGKRPMSETVMNVLGFRTVIQRMRK